MEGSILAIILKAANERVAFNLKDYFDLAKEEVDKTVRVEELGMVSETIVCHRNAQRILVEAGSNPTHRISTLASLENAKQPQIISMAISLVLKNVAAKLVNSAL